MQHKNINQTLSPGPSSFNINNTFYIPIIRFSPRVPLNPLYTGGFFHLAWYNEVGKVYCTIKGGHRLE